MIKTGYQSRYTYVQEKKIGSVNFSFFDQEEIQRMSVANLTSDRIYDEITYLPNRNAVNDPRMGVCQRDQICQTCGGDQADCPGHFGHIELARPVYHVGMIDIVRKLLKVFCFNCSKLLIHNEEQRAKLAKIKYPKMRFYHVLKHCEATFYRECDQSQGGCGFKQPKIQRKSIKITVQHFDSTMLGSKGDQVESLMAEDALKILLKVSKEDASLVGIQKPQSYIIRRLAVAPPCVRPSVQMGSTMRSEDDLTYSYQAIIKNNNFLRQQLEKGCNQTTINELTFTLQYFVSTLMDNSISGQPVHKQKSGKPLRAIKERLKGKEGRLRGNLMGKRVDFSARTVITPDPSLALDQVGVPMKIASNLTIPETVTQYNMDEMRNLVANGPTTWPGAKYIIRTDGKMIDLSMLANRSDAHLEYGYKVERHLKNDDYVLFNRQPSLHKMSIMGHRVKVLPFSTFRLNLSVTSPYNADFDGDEMNMFVPQSFETVAEIKEIMAVPRQIVSPQANKPVMGIVQDSLLGVMLFTKKDNFIDKETFMNLCMQLQGEQKEFAMNQLPMPAVIKPKPLWTGKQVMSLIIPGVNMLRKAGAGKHKVSAEDMRERTNYASPQDRMLIIQKGELIQGEFTKAIVGSASGGLNHVIWREKGPNFAKEFLTDCQNVVNRWLVEHGFTVGVEDTIATAKTNNLIKDTLDSHKRKVDKIISKSHLGTLSCQPGKNMLESFEANVNKTLNEARDKAGDFAYKNLAVTNKIQNMVKAGSKGTYLNISQIMGCVGQQNVEGKRIPFGFNNRSLPHFSKFDYGPTSKGFVENNYITGLNAEEFFFHAMGGREGLIDTAVKTSETGYIQRRLVKALEDVMVKYDGTVRNCSNQIVQFVYGEDGMAGECIEDLRIDIFKMSDAQIKKKFAFDLASAKTEDDLRKVIQPALVQSLLNSANVQTQLRQEYEQILADRQKLRNEVLKNGEDMVHLPINLERMILNCKQIFDMRVDYGIRSMQKSDLSPQYVVQEVKKLCDSLSLNQGVVKADKFNFIQESNNNATSLCKIYLRSLLASKRIILDENFTAASFDWLLGEIKHRFQQSMVNPGEVVGSIAAHSLGEPATQMTLNTFHFAGVSSKNVTLGVPRLKEIINVAKNIKTPIMQIFLDGSHKKSEKSVMSVQGIIEHTTLADIVDSSQIYYDPDPKHTCIADDTQLVELYEQVQAPCEGDQQINSPWLLRFELNAAKMLSKQVEINFIEQKLSDSFGDMIQIMHSDANDDKQVMRIRFKDLVDEQDETAVELLKDCESDLLHDLMLKGIPEIKKVYAKKYSEHDFDSLTGEHKVSDDNWMLETDGVCLKKIFYQPMVDASRTISNDLLEIKEVLGTEASRQALCNEFRAVLNFYGIYVNYRHISILCDMMAQKGKLTSITRHGINRLDSGPLRKCSFEETCEILVEAAAHNESDKLLGVTENVIMGQLAPIGTGSFDIVLDALQVNENAKQGAFAAEGVESEHGTPVMDEAGPATGGAFTPFIGETPFHRVGQNSEYGGQSERGAMSAYEAAFSPGMNMFASPAYASPNAYASSPAYRSPAYASPAYGSPGSPAYGNIKAQSPIYQAYASPIYQQVSADNTSPNNRGSPNAMRCSGVSPNYSPSNLASASPYAMGNHSKPIVKANYSPSYSPAGLAGASPASPNYSPMGSHRAVDNANKSGIHSPAYSPNLSANNFSSHSPNYSPSAQMQFGGSSHHQQTQIKQNYSPSYSPSSSAFNKSPGYAQRQGTTPHSISKHSPKYTSEHSPYSPSAMGSASLHHHPHLGQSSAQGYSATGGGSSIGAAGGVQAYIPSNAAGAHQLAYNPASPVYKQENSSDDEEQTKK